MWAALIMLPALSKLVHHTSPCCMSSGHYYCLPKFEEKPLIKVMNLMKWEDYLLSLDNNHIEKRDKIAKECPRKRGRFTVEEMREREALDMEEREDHFSMFEPDEMINTDKEITSIEINAAAEAMGEKNHIDDDDFLAVRGLTFE